MGQRRLLSGFVPERAYTTARGGGRQPEPDFHVLGFMLNEFRSQVSDAARLIR